MDALLIPLANVIGLAITLFIWLLVISAVLGWLVAFDVVNRHNRVVSTILDFSWRLTEPALRPIRNVIPNLGGIDISPVILILLLIFLRDVIYRLAFAAAT